MIPGWKEPIVIGRHAFGDQYKATDLVISEPGKLELRFTPKMAVKPKLIRSTTTLVQVSDWPCTTPTNLSVGLLVPPSTWHYPRTCHCICQPKHYFEKYDGRFKDIFQDIYENEYASEFEKKGLWYEHRLIDDMVAQMIKSKGGFVMALKNYDGDVQSDIVAQGFGSLGLMTSALMTPDGKAYEAEAAHGTVTRHYRQHQQGKETSTNSIASIFAWTRGLAQRGRLDETPEVVDFADKLEKATIDTVEVDRIMTKDLALAMGKTDRSAYVTTTEFLDAVADRLKK